MQLTTTRAKPFLKWAGGKSQLIDQIANYLPNELIRGKIHRYVEPFIGGGAVFFHIAQSYKVSEFYISDINEELILAYTTIQKDVNSLIDLLRDMESEYYELNPDEQEDYYYEIRILLNRQLKKFNFNKFQNSWVDLGHKAEMDMSVENQTITVFVPVNIPLDQADKDKIDTAMDVPIDAVVKDSKKPKKVKVEFDEPEVSNEDDPF